MSPHKGAGAGQAPLAHLAWLSCPAARRCGSPSRLFAVKSNAAACGSGRQSRRRLAVHLSCSEPLGYSCLWCLLFACQKGPFHLCPVVPETHAGEAQTQTLCMPDPTPAKPSSAQPRKHYDAINVLCSFHRSRPPRLSTSAFLHSSEPVSDLWKPRMQVPVRQCAMR